MMVLMLMYTFLEARRGMRLARRVRGTYSLPPAFSFVFVDPPLPKDLCLFYNLASLCS